MNKSGKRFGTTMQFKITVCLCIFIIMPVMVFFVFSNFQMRRQKKEDIEQYSEMYVKQLKNDISGQIDTLVKSIYVFSYGSLTNGILNNAADSDTITKRIADFNMLLSQIDLYSEYQIQIFVPDYMISTRNSDNENNIVSMACLEDKKWYKELIDGNYQYYFFMDSDKDGNNISVAHRILSDNDMSKTVGVVKFGYDAKQTTDIINTNKVTPGTHNYLLDSKGKSIVPGADALPPNIAGSVPGLFNSGDGINISEDSQNVYISSAFNSADWFFLSVVPKKDINSDMNRTTFFWIITALILCITASLAARLIVVTINRPISYLSREINSGRMKCFDADEFPIDLRPIVNAYNNDLKRINRLIEESYEIRQQTKELGVELLNLQIHPHFLYNALNMLHWEAKKQGCNTVEEGIEALSSFLRLSIERKSEIVPLYDELEHVRGYIKILNMRYGDFVEFDYNIPDKYMNVSIPCFTLQPLIENAVNHGILLKKTECGKITLTVKEEGDDLLISICDDGVGIESDKMRKLNYELHDGVREISGIGLYDVNMRLRLFFGVKYYLVFNRYDSGTAVTVRIPLNYDIKLYENFDGNGISDD